MKHIVVDIGGTNIQYAVINEANEIDYFEEYPNDISKGGRVMIEDLSDRLENHLEDVAAVGLSTAGQVDSQNGVIVFANDNIPGYTGVQVTRILTDRLGIPATIENDVKAAALGEKHFGKKKDLGDFIMMTYGTGIGGAAFIDGKLFKGSNHGAGEFGHMITHIDGRECKCGQRGCYERYGSTAALVRTAQAIDPAYHNGRVIMEKVQAGDPDLQKVYQEWIHEIGQGLISIIICFQPTDILLGGGIMENAQVVADVEVDVKDNLMPSFAHVKIQPASLGNKAGLYGVLYLARQLAG